MFERFTKQARELVLGAGAQRAQAWSGAQGAARRLGDDRMGGEHLLLGLVNQGDDVAATVLAGFGVTTEAVERELLARRTPPGRLGPADTEALAAIGIDLDQIRRRAEATFGAGALERTSRQRRGHLPLTVEGRRAVQAGLQEARALGHKHVGTEHILLGLLSQPDEMAVAILRALGAPPEAVRARVLDELRKAS